MRMYKCHKVGKGMYKTGRLNFVLVSPFESAARVTAENDRTVFIDSWYQMRSKSYKLLFNNRMKSALFSCP